MQAAHRTGHADSAGHQLCPVPVERTPAGEGGRDQLARCAQVAAHAL